MVASCSFAFLCGRQCRGWHFSLDPSCQTRPATLCKQCSPTPNWGSSDRPLKALHEATHRREKIRGQDTSLWPGLRAGLIKVLFSFKADPILTEEAIFELYYDTDSESAWKTTSDSASHWSNRCVSFFSTNSPVVPPRFTSKTYFVGSRTHTVETTKTTSRVKNKSRKMLSY